MPNLKATIEDLENLIISESEYEALFVKFGIDDPPAQKKLLAILQKGSSIEYDAEHQRLIV